MVSKSYDQSKFKKILNNKTKLKFKSDNSDLLVYLIYIHYLNKLVKDDVNDVQLEERHKLLLKQFKG